MSPRILEKSDYKTLVKTTALIGEIAAVHADLAVSLMGHSPELIESVGFAGLEKLAHFSAAIAGSSRTYALKTVENSLSVIQPLKEMGGIPLIRSVFNLGIKMAADDWNYALEFLEKSPAIVVKTPRTKGHGSTFLIRPSGPFPSVPN